MTSSSNPIQAARHLPFSIVDVWSMLSDAANPEVWLPFIDSRRLSSDPRPRNFYYPSRSARAFVDSLLRVELSDIQPNEKSLSFALVGDRIRLEVQLSLLPGPTGCECNMSMANEPAEVPPEVLGEFLRSISQNIERVCVLKFARTEATSASLPSSPPALLSERHPDMKVRRIERINMRTLATAGLEKIMATTKPIIISDYGSTLPHFDLLKSWDFWSKQFGDQTAPVQLFGTRAYNKNEDQELQTTIAVVIDALRNPKNQQRFAIYEHVVGSVIGLGKFLPRLAVLPSHASPTPDILWMASKHVCAPIHQDEVMLDQTGVAPWKLHNLNFHVVGRKHWIIAHPSQSKFLYPAPLSQDDVPGLQVDFFEHVDTQRFPLLREAEIFEEVVTTGELLYVPRGWWHEIYTQEDSINVNTFFRAHDY